MGRTVFTLLDLVVPILTDIDLWFLNIFFFEFWGNESEEVLLFFNSRNILPESGTGSLLIYYFWLDEKYKLNYCIFVGVRSVSVERIYCMICSVQYRTYRLVEKESDTYQAIEESKSMCHLNISPFTWTFWKIFFNLWILSRCGPRGS